jgi:adenine-specific DNA-methyltransferase
MSIELKHADCLEYLSTVPDESVNLVVVDPPYFEIIKDAWDNQWASEKEYLDWCQEWTSECFRVLKPGGCFYVWGTTKQDTFLRYKLEVLNHVPEAHYQNWIIWAYDWGGRTKKKFPRKHEDILMYSKGKDFPFYPDQVMVPRKVRSNMNIKRKINLLQKKINGDTFSGADIHSWEKYNFHRLDEGQYQTTLVDLESKDTKMSAGKIPTDVWTKNNHTTSKEYAGWHTTQKPISLLERIIKAHTQPGETVVDCFSGSGSAMIACQNTGRNFKGCEFDNEYIEKSWERLEKLTDFVREGENNV